jgi:hypothetical protein
MELTMAWSSDEKRRVYMRQWKDANPGRMAEYSRKQREKDKGNPIRLKQQREYAKVHRAQVAKGLKEETFMAYGGIQCACCGETHLVFLTLDHIGGGGTAMRKKFKLNGSTAVYLFLKNRGYPPGYQVLCFNCNVGQHINGGVCPHKGEV